MMIKRIALASIVAFTAALAGAAQAVDTGVAGWDFSQYAIDGIRTIDGTTTTTSLSANYSAFDPTFNAGTESAAFGTATLGTSIVPHNGSLVSNLYGLANQFGMNRFDSLSILKAEGQLFREFMGLTNESGSADSVVFMADLTSVVETGSNWGVSFGGQSIGGDSEVLVEFSTDGSSYSGFGTVVLDEDDAEYAVALAPTVSETGYVRLTLDPTVGQPVIDNVVITVPEPTGTLGLLAGVFALMGLSRRRRA